MGQRTVEPDMNGSIQSDNGPGRLADKVAELLKRFRHFDGVAQVAPGLASHLARIKISARLLPGAGLPAETARAGFVRLSGVLAELVARYESVPESLPRNLAPPVARLADYLEEVLGRLDDGVPLATVALDGGWGTVQASFENAGTPLEVFEDVEDLFRKWDRRWALDDLTPIRAKDLGRRWRRLKEQGDHLFLAGEFTGAEPGRADAGPPGAPSLVLLVDSSFLRERIRDKLQEAGFRVELPEDPGRTLAHLEREPAVQAVLCDNLEPTRHLVRLAAEVADHSMGRVPPFILVAGGALVHEEGDRRARALGAQAVWADPFRAADLRRILQRLSQP
jgi:CheY-like chemotaxis protein